VNTLEPSQAPLLHWLSEQAPFGVAWCVPAGPVALNQRGAELLAADRREYPREQFGALVEVIDSTGRVIPAEESPLGAALRGERLERTRVHVSRPDGHRTDLVVSAFPLESSPSPGAVMLFEDASSSSESDWLAALAHEMSGALQFLINSIALAERVLEREPSRARHHLDAAGRQLPMIRRLMGGFIDAARLGAGPFEVRAQPFSVRELLEEMVEAHENSDPRHRILLEGEGEPRALADRDRLRQILTNLLANAAKYAVPGLLTLGARTEQDRVVLWLHDEGPGISESEQAVLFERYQRPPSHTEGFGMGLWISRQLAERMGGGLWVQSADGGPTTFFVSLPAAPR
jgi:signal transduction histidine kinase